jgi:DNA-binding MarR family transcriptional regulator
MSAYEGFFTELVRLEIDLWDRLEQLHASQGVVSVAQLQALRAIGSARGNARVQDISTALQITVGAASKLVDRLERDGLAARAAHPSDRRSMIISLTSSGEIALEEAAGASDQSLTKLLSDILQEEQATELAATLSSVRSSLGSRPTAAPSAGAPA